MNTKLLCGMCAACGMLFHSDYAAGAGVAILEQSAKRLGTAFAGGAAAADDAASIFYNPAGLTRLPRTLRIALRVFPTAIVSGLPRESVTP